MKYDKFLWIAMFFSIGYFLWLKMAVDWDWNYWILGFTITMILLGLYFYGKDKEIKNEKKPTN